jgi:hypothetical protein
MMAAGTSTAWAGAMLAAVRAIVSARTWLAVIHLVMGWFTGLVVFLILVVAVPVGIALLPIFLAGAPILWVVLVLSRLYAGAERSRFALMLDARIPDPATGPPPAARWWQRLRQRLTAAQTWKQLGYALLSGFPSARCR